MYTHGARAGVLGRRVSQGYFNGFAKEEDDGGDDDAGKGERHDECHGDALKVVDGDIFALFPGIGFHDFANDPACEDKEDEGPKDDVGFEKKIVLVVFTESE